MSTTPTPPPSEAAELAEEVRDRYCGCKIPDEGPDPQDCCACRTASLLESQAAEIAHKNKVAAEAVAALRACLVIIRDAQDPNARPLPEHARTRAAIYAKTAAALSKLSSLKVKP